MYISLSEMVSMVWWYETWFLDKIKEYVHFKKQITAQGNENISLKDMGMKGEVENIICLDC